MRTAKLSSPADWDALERDLFPQRTYGVLKILGHVRSMGAQSVLIESIYLDRDYSAAYSSFYSQIFRLHDKICIRLHFFNVDIVDRLTNSSSLDRVLFLEELSKDKNYLGFAVIRPVKHAPIVQAVLAAPQQSTHPLAETSVTAEHEVHIAGASLVVTGAPYTQQDSHVGSCAQASIWMCGRHFHIKHRGPWVSAVDITAAATALHDMETAKSLPAGAEFLTPGAMVRALRAMGRFPILFIAPEIRGGSPLTFNWHNLRPKEIIFRYIDSGIPVILGLAALPGQTIGHAVTAVGHVSFDEAKPIKLPTKPTTAEFSEYLIVNDDQLGPYVGMPVFRPTGSAAPYSVEDNVVYIIVPLPNKVFMRAEFAEEISWDLLNQFTNNVIPTQYGSLGQAEVFAKEVQVEFSNNRVVARTYLTHGWKYKSRLLNNDVPEVVKAAVFDLDLPRYVWVTEFGTHGSLKHNDVRKRRIFGHCVVDATSSSHFDESWLVIHCPGLIETRSHDPQNRFGNMAEKRQFLTDGGWYYPKETGNRTFEGF